MTEGEYELHDALLRDKKNGNMGLVLIYWKVVIKTPGIEFKDEKRRKCCF